MDKFVIRTSKNINSCDREDNLGTISGEKRARVEFDSTSLIADPANQISIDDYEINIRDEVRRAYVLKGPCQPKSHMFPQKKFGKQNRSFQKTWFIDYLWLEYSVSKDAGFCFWCYLFKPPKPKSQGGREVFTKTGFINWKNAKVSLGEHIGNVDSDHNYAARKYQAYKNQRQSVEHIFAKHSSDMEVAYRTRLTAVLDAIRFLLKQGLAFRGHDESSDSLSRGNFIELLQRDCDHNEEIAKVLNINAPGNNQMTYGKIQKELVNACAEEVRTIIINDIGDRVFSLMVDESRDNSVKEQMAIMVRYVDGHGEILERFLSVEHVADTSSHTLKQTIDNFFAKYGLSISRLRGQAYDGASNMRGEFNGLKSLILNENPYARYVHCFAHQLQLAVVAVAKTLPIIENSFSYLSLLVNTVGASCKRKDALRQSQHDLMVTRLENGEISSGRGLHQETSLVRPGDTRWGSHYQTILRILLMWSSVMEVLGNVHDDATGSKEKGAALGLLDRMENFEFVFTLHLMKKVLAITNGLSQVLQEKNQNIVNALDMVRAVKVKFQSFREDGWNDLFDEIRKFCVKNSIDVPNLEDSLSNRWRSKREGQTITYSHRFRVEIFSEVIDVIVQEMNDRFSEGNLELLSCLTCLDPRQSFSRFDALKLHRLAELYPDDFSTFDLILLSDQLEIYIHDVRQNADFVELVGLGELAKKLIETEKYTVYPLIYRLIELALVLPVSTASVERAFSAMNIIKTDLRNKMGDEFLSDSLSCFIEKQIFVKIDDEPILQRFQSMQTRRIQLPPRGRD
ncbi:uncharacterized protein LOC126660062 [Mercurialis annua]|uniref:uncharacterized protein LOC126660062 n=1 Tax=Mercurialis annua TaxID=3986 RepID=UPI00215E0029|nr:uncharacterized protein LOC126660062 [Mercurialis annua]XP_050209347.1 uncharacterized protein LOC126660062 [Mercurialis annua]